jgi:predicted DNA binding protein
MVVLEFAVPAETLALSKTLEEFPDIIIEFEQLVPTNHSPLPYFWATDGNTPAFQETVADDPHVARITKVTTFEEGALYGLEWSEGTDGLLEWSHTNGDRIAVLHARGQADEWALKLRFPDRATLWSFRNFCDDRGIDLRIIRLYDLLQPKMGEYNITAKQREALLRALEMGHFAIPREATLEDVAESLDISARATSERLRRGQTNLVSNTLTIGQLTGVGLGEQ